MWFKIQLTISTRNSSWYANLFTVPFYQDTRIFTKAGQLWKLLLIKPGKTITFSPNSFQLTYFRNLVSLVFKYCLRPVLEVHKSLHEGSTVYSRIYVSCLVNARFEFFFIQWCSSRVWKGYSVPPKVLICWKSGKNPWKSGQKWCPTLFDFKNGAQRFYKNKWRPFFGSHTKKRSENVAWQLFGQKSFAPPKICLLLHLCFDSLTSGFNVFAQDKMFVSFWASLTLKTTWTDSA